MIQRNWEVQAKSMPWGRNPKLEGKSNSKSQYFNIQVCTILSCLGLYNLANTNHQNYNKIKDTNIKYLMTLITLIFLQQVRKHEEKQEINKRTNTQD